MELRGRVVTGAGLGAINSYQCYNHFRDPCNAASSGSCFFALLDTAGVVGGLTALPMLAGRPGRLGEYSVYEDITTGRRGKNLKTDTNLDEFRRELERAGYKREGTSHPDIMQHTKDGNKYVTRPFSNEGSATADYYRNGSLKAKIRLGD